MDLDNTEQTPSETLQVDQALSNYLRRFVEEPYSTDFAQTAVKAAPEEPSGQERYVTSLCSKLLSKYQQADTKNARNELQKAIDVWRLWRNPKAQNGPERADYFAKLGSLVGMRYLWSHDLKDLEEIIALYQEAVKHDSDRLDCIKMLWKTLQWRCEHTEKIAHLNEAISSIQYHLEKIPKDDPERVVFLFQLARLMGCKCEQNGTLEDLHSAINLMQREGLDALPDAHPNRLEILNEYGNLLRLKGERLKSLEDVEEAIRIAKTVLKATRAEGPQRLNHVGRLACRYDTKYELTRKMEDLEEAIRLGLEVLPLLKALPRETTRPAALYSNLSRRYWYKYERTEDMKDLREAIRHGKDAVEATPQEHQSRSSVLTDLGSLWAFKFRRTQKPKDLDNAIKLLKAAGKATPPGHPNRGTYLNSLSNRLRSRFEAFGDPKDLDHAISMAEDAMKVLRLDRPNLGMHSNNLSNLYGLKYERTGHLDDLQEAISNGRKALEATPIDDPYRSTSMNSLTRWLSAKATETSAIEDLEIAIQMGYETVKATPEEYLYKYMHLNTLAALLRQRYRRTARDEDLEEAINIGRKILHDAPGDHPDRALFLSTLSNMLRSKTRNELESRPDTSKNTEEALALSRRALDATLPGDPNRPGLLNNLATALESYYWLKREFRDLEESIELGRKAITATPDDHPSMGLFKFNLAVRLESTSFGLIVIDGKRYPWPDEATTLFLESFHSTSSPPFIRIRAGWMAGRNFGAYGDWSKASKILNGAVRLLPRISPRWLSRDDQQHLLNDLSGLSALAATATLQADKGAPHAQEILEAGRGIMAGLVMDSRTDLSELKRAHPTKAYEYQKLRDRLSSPTPGSSLEYDVGVTGHPMYKGSKDTDTAITLAPVTVDDRRADVERLSKLEDEIRELHGFELFQRSLSAKELVSLAEDGHLVSFNVTEYRSDVLIVNKSGIHSVPLTKLVYGELTECAKALVGEAKLSKGDWQTEDERNEKVRKILRWLWDSAVLPVLEFLGVTAADDTGKLLRIWWVANGLMGLMPIHAAGNYDEDGTWSQTTSLYAISSYTPTLKAHQYARSRKLQHLGAAGQKLLIVAMPETFGEYPLDTERETVMIGESIEPIRPKVLLLPTKAEVLNELLTSTVAHFACHGISDSRDPSKGALLLRHAERDRNDHLTIRELAAVNHDHAQIAYLSACSTAENAAEGLMDEVIHVASAFQLIGFSHVIGTLWEADDDTATEVARLFYKGLVERMNHGGWHGSSSIVAEALYEAVEIRKEAGVTNFLAWAPFIHLGA